MTTQQTDAELLTKADCRRLGLSRPDVDRIFNRSPLVVLPDSKYAYIRRGDLDAWIQGHTITAPRHGKDD